MEEKKSLTLLEEEILCEKVREFPIIYDKAQKGHKEKDAVTNCWNAMAKDLDFTENGRCNFLGFFIYNQVISTTRNPLIQNEKFTTEK